MKIDDKSYFCQLIIQTKIINNCLNKGIKNTNE